MSFSIFWLLLVFFGQYAAALTLGIDQTEAYAGAAVVLRIGGNTVRGKRVFIPLICLLIFYQIRYMSS